ncbi:extracellular solute-binding protein [Ciceribacter sp. L1K23]|uniref:extracellular solute-binding protein n=1 Tax=unclassified Ciceribacter TaxID=2628820 RepID=UPI001ABDF4B7|nr:MULTISPECIES: extracellular solute-binding protein [unclassified Ciceribacter]MBO3759214.1 extracellular solute-binding protein [Ciceribacter sp. L1K22]MBR0556638.1 extracellular solute-binding protein [Ciceribacter sp. L1K23]
MTILNKPLTRRTILKSTAIGAGVLAAPGIISSSALASSGELNFTGWAGYPGMTEKVFPAFEKATGIKVNFTEQPDQDTMFAQAKISLETGTSDVIEPTLDRVSAWNANGLLQGWDTSKLAMDNYAPGLADGSADELATIDGQKLIVPSVWGTEALVYSKEDFPTEYGKASLGDLFNPDNMVTVRGHSALAAMGRWLDAQGKLPKPWIDGYKDEATMVELWDIALAEAIKVKSNIVQFWNGENDAQAAFRTNGAVLGLCWDSTGFNMAKEGFGYLAPAEGAFAWNQGLVLLKSAKNVEQAHEFAKWVSTAEGSALWATAFSANPVGKGGIDLMDPAVAEFYKSSFPGDAVSKMYWWPSQAAWFLAKRGEYADKYKAA